MTEDQKIRYRDLLAKQSRGEKVDFFAFQKEVEEENSSKKTELQNLSNWVDKLSSTFSVTVNSYAEIEMEHIFRQQTIPKEFIIGANSTYDCVDDWKPITRELLGLPPIPASEKE